jgi:acyl carrier protein
MTLRLDPEAVYLLVGCFGGLGQSLATWMVERGARNLAFMARSGASSLSASRLVAELEHMGVNVEICKADVSNLHDVEAGVKAITKTRTLKGIVNAAMVLNDGMFERMTLDRWQGTMNPKVKGSWNLHQASLGMDLDFFIMASSVSGIIGSTGQANYAAANQVQDSICRNRRAQGLPATSLILSMIMGMGVVAENVAMEDSILRKGIYGIHEDEILSVFEAAMMPPSTTICPDHIIFGLDPVRLARSVYAPEALDVDWINDVRLSHINTGIKRTLQAQSGISAAAAANSSILATVQSATSTEDAIEATVQGLIKRLARLLGLDENDVSADGRSISEHGLDSMIATEFRNWMTKEFGTNVPYQHLNSPGMTVEKLAKELVEKVMEKDN